MLKFEVFGKELKEVIEKALTVVPKKSSVSILERMLIESTENGIKIIVTDMDQWLEVTIEATILEPGKILIDSSDMKLLLKMSDYITITEIEGGKIDIKTSKKNISMNNYNMAEYPECPQVPDEIEALKVEENYLLATTTDLYSFSNPSNSNRLFQIYNFNLKDKRVEVLDGHRIGMKSLESQTILNESSELHLHVMACAVFKKLLDKKSKNQITMCDNEKYTIVKGANFKYLQRKVEGKYFDISKMLLSNYDHRMVLNCKELLEVSKYNCELLKAGVTDKMPMYFYSTGNDIVTYFNNGKIESVDKLTTKNTDVKKDFTIAFNPVFIKEAISIIDSETALCTMTNAKSSIMIYGKEYSFLILPVNMKPETVDNMRSYLLKIGIIDQAA